MILSTIQTMYKNIILLMIQTKWKSWIRMSHHVKKKQRREKHSIWKRTLLSVQYAIQQHNMCVFYVGRIFAKFSAVSRIQTPQKNTKGNTRIMTQDELSRSHVQFVAKDFSPKLILINIWTTTMKHLMKSWHSYRVLLKACGGMGNVKVVEKNLKMNLIWNSSW